MLLLLLNRARPVWKTRSDRGVSGCFPAWSVISKEENLEKPLEAFLPQAQESRVSSAERSCTGKLKLQSLVSGEQLGFPSPWEGTGHSTCQELQVMVLKPKGPSVAQFPHGKIPPVALTGCNRTCPSPVRKFHCSQQPWASLSCLHHMNDGAAGLLNPEATGQIVFSLVIFFLFHQSQSSLLACIAGICCLYPTLPSIECDTSRSFQNNIFFVIFSKLCMSHKISKYCLFQMGSWSRLLWRG